MLGSIIVFLVVCGIVAIYMAVVHSFLRESERSPEEQTVASPPPDREPSPKARVEDSRRVHWAH
jgi:hypothetical protein